MDNAEAGFKAVMDAVPTEVRVLAIILLRVHETLQKIELLLGNLQPPKETIKQNP